MSLSKKIEADIKTWETKIQKELERIQRMKQEIKQLRKLLGMAGEYEQQ